MAEILGEIVWLMTQDPAGREMKVAEIEALVMPAILARRFHIKYAQVPGMRRPGATLQPISVAILGSKSCEMGAPEVDTSVSNGSTSGTSSSAMVEIMEFSVKGLRHGQQHSALFT
ncbi:MAG: toxin-activating lysine-acyltransferase [Paracoccus sp. (in: a-proteobacteria)]